MSQEIYSKYASDKAIMQKLYDAKDYEQDLLSGQDLGDNSVLKSWIGKETGFWESVLNLPYGKVFFMSLDLGITKVSVTTVEKRLAIVPPEVKDFEINFKDLSSIKSAKEYFKNDPVMKNTFVDTYQSKALSEILALVIKSFRRKYLAYNKEYSSLWVNTSANSALSLFEEMKNLNLLSTFY